jgi:hypothetical protein
MFLKVTVFYSPPPPPKKLIAVAEPKSSRDVAWFFDARREQSKWPPLTEITNLKKSRVGESCLK